MICKKQCRKNKEPEEKVAWGEELALRNLESESYFQAAFFSELEKVIYNNNQNLIIGLKEKVWVIRDLIFIFFENREVYLFNHRVIWI